MRKHLNQMTAVLSRKNVVISRFPLSLNKIHAFIYKCVVWAHIDEKVLPSNDHLINILYETMCCQALGKMGSPKPDVGLRSQLETLQKQVQRQFFSSCFGHFVPIRLFWYETVESNKLLLRWRRSERNTRSASTGWRRRRTTSRRRPVCSRGTSRRSSPFSSTLSR